jgi:hypothetical protein
MIHLVWSGKGFWVPVVTFLSGFGMEFFVRAEFHDDHYYQTHGWPILCAFLFSAAVIAVIAKMCVRERILRDVKTGEDVVIRENHTFVFVNIKFWPYILVALGGAFYAAAEAGKL